MPAAPVLMFYGIVVTMFFDDCRRHRKPHIHVEYQIRRR